MILFCLSFALAQTANSASAPIDGLVVSEGDGATLKEFLAAGDKYNLDKRIAHEQVRRASAEFAQSWLGLLPALTASGSYVRNQYEAVLDFAKLFGPIGTLLGDVVKDSLISGNASAQTIADATALQAQTAAKPVTIQPYNALNATLRADLPVIDAARWARVAAGSALEDASKARETLTTDQVHRTIIASYYGYLAALALLESTQKTLAFSEAQLKLTASRRDVGTATELDLARANAEVQRSLQGIADAKSTVAVAARALRTLTGRSPSANLSLPPDNLAKEPPVEELEAKIDSLPAVVAAQLDMRSMDRVSTAAKLAFIPTVNAFAQEAFSNAAGFTGQYSAYSLGLIATLRVDGPSFAALATQGANAEAARLQNERARLLAHDQIFGDWQRFNAALTKIQSAEAQVQAAEKAARVASARYEAGATTQLELIQATRDNFTAEVLLIQARTDLAIARGSLRISSGRSLD